MNVDQYRLATVDFGIRSARTTVKWIDELLLEIPTTDEVKEEAHQINRRTEFKVLRTDYVIQAEKFGKP